MSALQSRITEPSNPENHAFIVIIRGLPEFGGRIIRSPTEDERNRIPARIHVHHGRTVHCYDVAVCAHCWLIKTPAHLPKAGQLRLSAATVHWSIKLTRICYTLVWPDLYLRNSLLIEQERINLPVLLLTRPPPNLQIRYHSLSRIIIVSREPQWRALALSASSLKSSWPIVN